MKKKVYLVWSTEGCESDDENTGYWNTYESLSDAVGANEFEEIYVASPRLIGKFKRTTKMIKIKKNKPRRKK